MSVNKVVALGEKEAEVLRRIENHGALTCTGSCLQRKAGELHCMNLAPALGMTNKEVWRVIVALVEKGLLERRRDEKARCWRITPTEEGRKALDSLLA